MVSRKISSSSGRTASSKDTMIEVLGKPETTDSSYNSSREFIPTRAPPPPKSTIITMHIMMLTLKKMEVVLNHQRYRNKRSFRNFQKAIQEEFPIFI